MWSTRSPFEETRLQLSLSFPNLVRPGLGWTIFLGIQFSTNFVAAEFVLRPSRNVTFRGEKKTRAAHLSRDCAGLSRRVIQFLLSSTSTSNPSSHHHALTKARTRWYQVSGAAWSGPWSEEFDRMSVQRVRRAEKQRISDGLQQGWKLLTTSRPLVLLCKTCAELHS